MSAALTVVHDDLDRVVHRRRNEYRGERRLPLVVRVERRQAHEPVHAVLALEIAVGELAHELDGSRLDADFVAFLQVGDAYLIAVRFAPAHVHTQQHRGPVEAFGAAGSGVDLHDRAQMVLLAAEHVAHFERFDHAERLAVLLVELVRRCESLLDEIGHQLQVVGRLRDFVVGRDPILDRRDLLQLLFGPFAVVPEIGRLRLGFFFFQFDTSVGDVKDASPANPVALQSL